MGQLQAPANLKPLPALPWSYELEHPSIQRMKQTPFLRSTVYSYEPSIFYEKPDILLPSLVTPRMGTKGLFPQNEILKLMKSLIDGLAYLESKQIRFGDVHSENIYYDKFSKSFKLVNPHTIQQTGYELALSGKRFSFLSPECLLALSEGKTSCDLKVVQKSDVFALGILMIEVCTLKNSSELYDPENYDILHGVIQERLALIKGQYYSEKVSKPIGLMIEYDMDNRLSATQLKAILDSEQRQANLQANLQSGVQTIIQHQQPPANQSNSRVKLNTPAKNQVPPNQYDDTRRAM